MNQISGCFASLHFKPAPRDSVSPNSIINRYNRYNENVDIIVLGLPLNMNNSMGERANKTIVFKEKLSNYLNKEVFLQDERLSSVEANNYLIEADMSRKKRKMKVDSIAATIILETFMERRKNNG